MWLLVLQLKESEWQATDWISMYLELVITTTDRSITEVSFTYIYISINDIPPRVALLVIIII